MRVDIETPSGTAWADLDRPRGTLAGLVVAGHGAGGSIDSPDLLALRDAALDLGFTAARITQPYRVAGRRAPAAAPRLDEAWLAAITALRRRRGFGTLPLVVAGRSSGARVACRTALAANAAAVIALAFPVHPPGKPERSRLDEIDDVTVPVLVVQGDRDAFGIPPAAKNRKIVTIPGADHGLKKDPPAVADAVREFLRVSSKAPARSSTR